MGLSKRYDIYAYKELLAIIIPQKLLIKYKQLIKAKENQ